MGVQGGIFIGVGNMDQAVEYKLTENESGSNKKEQFAYTMYTDLQTLTHALAGNDRVTQHGVSSDGPKIERFEGRSSNKSKHIHPEPRMKRADAAERIYGWAEES